MTKIRTLVVDDEPVARERIVGLLRPQADIELVGQCTNGPETIAAITDLSPDLVFLDVQMPEMSGFDVMRALDASHVPAVVFVTAYDEYAVRAFEYHAVDYLLKPFSSARFGAMLAHAREHLDRGRASDLGRKVLALAPTLFSTPAQAAPPAPERLLVRSNGRIHFVRPNDIDWLEASGNYVRLHVGPETHLFRETLAGVASKLDSQQFLRIHRSTIVNVERIREVQSTISGECLVLLRGGAELTLSRGYREAFQERFGPTL